MASASPRKKRRKSSAEQRAKKATSNSVTSKTTAGEDNLAAYNTKEVYETISRETKNKFQSDVLYRILFANDEMSSNACKKMRNFLVNKYPSLSARLRAMIDYACTTEHKVAQHALIMFALSSEEGAADVLSSMGTLPSEKFVHFRDHALATETLNLLQGKTTSMRAYVEDVRSAYFTE